MYKIALLGVENSHAKGFLRQIRSGRFPDIEVTGVFSEERAAAEKLREEFNVPVLESYAECAGKVDGVMITARHGDNHLKYAEPYFAVGIPMFIDKPITIDPAEAITLVEKAKKHGVRLCGGSSCVYMKQTEELQGFVRSLKDEAIVGGNVVAPIRMESPYGGFYFYAQHLIQILMAIFGEDPRAVSAVPAGKQVCLIMEYESFAVTATYAERLPYYYAEVFTEKRAEAKLLEAGEDFLLREMMNMDHLLRGGAMRITYDSLIRPVFVMDAVMRSLRQGKKAEITFPQGI